MILAFKVGEELQFYNSDIDTIDKFFLASSSHNINLRLEDLYFGC